MCKKSIYHRTMMNFVIKFLTEGFIFQILSMNETSNSTVKHKSNIKVKGKFHNLLSYVKDLMFRNI